LHFLCAWFVTALRGEFRLEFLQVSGDGLGDRRTETSKQLPDWRTKDDFVGKRG
jgi:hypothetical protein